ncbi:ribosomal protein S18-alanine N-acetyltransferase [Isobaculum melis]|uniref:Ribosomal-protein-alanine N-acetyltransferase n=1 Tax=Isobaculum melis TaxID=142588 RepID=A0A1H9TG12_9LACT|nr:ribosomal protein S18-alanine N-acetyltransferase [Isobaculum melis]SER96280.1 ribosomal-protein-alanine N-acetyltransferase [Isobaculum melis]
MRDKQLVGEIKCIHLPKEAEALGQDFFQLADQSYLTGSPWKPALFIEELQNQKAYYFAFYQKEVLLGFAGCHKVIDEVEVLSVAVAPEVKGVKIGEQLMLALIYEARNWQCTQILLEVRASNEPAQKLYQKVGFTQIGLRKKYYHAPQEDGIIMSLQLIDEK